MKIRIWCRFNVKTDEIPNEIFVADELDRKTILEGESKFEVLRHLSKSDKIALGRGLSVWVNMPDDFKVF